MNIEKEIEFLKLLLSTPMPPDPAPIPTARNGYVTVPFAIAEYFNKINVKLDLDKDGRMKTNDYLSLMHEYHIPMYAKIITFRAVTDEDFKKDQE